MDRQRPQILMIVGWLISLSFTGCASTQQELATYELESPRITQGIMTQDAPEDGIQQMAARLDQIAFTQVTAEPLQSVVSAGETPVTSASDSGTAANPSPNPDQTAVADAAAPSNTQVQETNRVVANLGKLVALPKLSRGELTELLTAVNLKLQTELNYHTASETGWAFLPAIPAGVTDVLTLDRSTGGQRSVLRLGLCRFVSQPVHVWLQGFIQNEAAEIHSNPELEQAVKLIESITTTMTEMRKELLTSDLAFQIIQVSYIDLKGAMEALKGFGITTLTSVSNGNATWKFEQLPVVAQLPTPTSEQTALLGQEAGAAGRGAFEISVTPSVATPLPGDPNMAPASRILVYYHPAHPEQFTRVQKLLTDYIDRPARQIFIEGLVLEISEEGLKELGVEWEFREGNFDLVMGSLLPGFANIPLETTSNFKFDNLSKLEQNWVVMLRAMVQDSKAEVLSRPSVLTLNNRQATIRVGTDIPIATSQEQGIVKDTSKIAFNFKYLATGISLNIRPRIAGEGDEVSMLVDTIVSAVVPDADLELRSSSGEVLASAPTIATRRVQTYTRIDNNTPFIIGGLVSKQYSVIRKKIPLLGDIPYLGVLFRSQSSSTSKREVIIVLTPHVLQERSAEKTLGRYLPKDEDKFDEFGNRLFRDSYRIRAEDVFDLSFLEENARLQHFRRIAQQAIDENFHRAATYPYNQFLANHIPGEEILVNRMIYEVIKRLDQQSSGWMDEHVNLDRLIYFSGQHVGGYEVQFLERVLAQYGQGTQYRAFFETHSQRALALIFREDPQAIRSGSLTRTPIPEVRILDCPNEKAWGELLWTLNQPDAEGRQQAAILIHGPQDLERLRRALMLKKVVTLNGGKEEVNLRQFSLGKTLLIPDPNPAQTHLIDADVAEYFFQTEHYYAATLQVIDRVIKDLERAQAAPIFDQQ